MAAIAEIMLAQLRMQLFAAAQLLKGDALKEFWKLIDDINAIRPVCQEEKRG